MSDLDDKEQVRLQIQHKIAGMLDVAHLAPGDEERVGAARTSTWLPRLYEERQAMLRDDLGRSWSIMQIFVPLALAPFAAVALVDDLTPTHVLLLGGASSLVLLFAVLHVNRMGTYADWSWAWLRAIEAEVGLDQEVNQHRRWPHLRMRHLNWAMLGGTLALWLGLFVAVRAGALRS